MGNNLHHQVLDSLNVTGIWRQKYEGTHGTNGFYLDFSDNSAATATTLGKDRSGNDNNFTPSNFSVSSGMIMILN